MRRDGPRRPPGAAPLESRGRGRQRAGRPM